jgi:hypothetical protein
MHTMLSSTKTTNKLRLLVALEKELHYSSRQQNKDKYKSNNLPLQITTITKSSTEIAVKPN